MTGPPTPLKAASTCSAAARIRLRLRASMAATTSATMRPTLTIRVRILQRVAGRLQYVPAGRQPHQWVLPVLEYRAVRGGHLEGYPPPDVGLRFARCPVSAAVRRLAASLYLPSQHVQL